jgi:hypothetical protein
MGGQTHQSNYTVLFYIVCPTCVEPYCDALLNIVLEVIPEDDACVEMRWTITCFKFESYFNELTCVLKYSSLSINSIVPIPYTKRTTSLQKLLSRNIGSADGPVMHLTTPTLLQKNSILQLQGHAKLGPVGFLWMWLHEFCHHFGHNWTESRTKSASFRRLQRKQIELKINLLSSWKHGNVFDASAKQTVWPW